MSKAVLTIQDIKVIEDAIYAAAISGQKVWDQDVLQRIKSKIKAFSLVLLEDRCCYCAKNFLGEFNMVMDIEHVLPKSKYKQFEFSPFNLSVACKRCNMNVKNEDDSFVVDVAVANSDPERVDNYRIVHPNLDNYFDHLQYDVVIRNNSKMIKYSVVKSSSKGAFTYSYFRLKELEISSLTQAQGGVRRGKCFQI